MDPQRRMQAQGEHATPHRKMPCPRGILTCQATLLVQYCRASTAPLCCPGINTFLKKWQHYITHKIKTCENRQTLSHMYPIHNSIKTLYVIQEVGKIKYNYVFLNIQGHCNKQPGKFKHELVKSHQLTEKTLNDQDFI